MWKYLDSSERVVLPSGGSAAFWKMVRLSLVLISLASGWLFIQSHQNISGNTSAVGEKRERIDDISGGLTAPGVRLYLHGSTAIGPDGIRVTTPSQDFDLVDLRQLKGLMRITDATSALRLVQMRILYEYEGGWSSVILEVSCIDREPGYRTASRSKADSSNDVEMVNSGMAAILSSKAYRLGGFQPPVVVKVQEGFQITRWVCCFNRFEGTQVQKWQETVSPDGGYRLQILLSKPVPDLPGTKWELMGRA